MDAYLTLANLRLVRARVAEAKEAMRKLVVVLENCGVDNLPSCEFLVQCSKNFVECEDFEGLNFVTEVGLRIDEGHCELMYFHAFALTKLGCGGEALDCLRELMEKEVSPDIREAAEEIVRSLSE